MFMNSLGQHIKTKRELLGYSLRTLSEKSNLSHSYIDRIEKGLDFRSKKDIMPTVDTLSKLSYALSIPLNELIEAMGYSLTPLKEIEHLCNTLNETETETETKINIEQHLNYLILALENKNSCIELYSKHLMDTTTIFLTDSLKNVLNLSKKLNEG